MERANAREYSKGDKMKKFNFKEFRKKLKSFNKEASKLLAKQNKLEKNISPKEIAPTESPYSHARAIMGEDYIKFNNKVLDYLEKTIPKNENTRGLFSFMQTVRKEAGYAGYIYFEFIDDKHIDVRYDGWAASISYDKEIKGYYIK